MIWNVLPINSQSISPYTPFGKSGEKVTVTTTLVAETVHALFFVSSPFFTQGIAQNCCEQNGNLGLLPNPPLPRLVSARPGAVAHGRPALPTAAHTVPVRNDCCQPAGFGIPVSSHFSRFAKVLVCRSSASPKVMRTDGIPIFFRLFPVFSRYFGSSFFFFLSLFSPGIARVSATVTAFVSFPNGRKEEGNGIHEPCRGPSVRACGSRRGREETRRGEWHRRCGLPQTSRGERMAGRAAAAALDRYASRGVRRPQTQTVCVSGEYGE